MKKILILPLLILTILIITSSATNEKNSNNNLKNQNNFNQVTTKVYVKIPNFKILDENSYETFTVIKEAEKPENYDGTLLRLQSNDLTYLTKVFISLKTAKIILYKKDLKTAEKLIEKGFNVIII